MGLMANILEWQLPLRSGSVDSSFIELVIFTSVRKAVEIALQSITLYQKLRYPVGSIIHWSIGQLSNFFSSVGWGLRQRQSALEYYRNYEML